MKNIIIAALLALSGGLYWHTTSLTSDLQEANQTIAKIEQVSKATETRLNAELAKNQKEYEARAKEYARMRDLVRGVAGADEPASYHLRLVIEELSK